MRVALWFIFVGVATVIFAGCGSSSCDKACRRMADCLGIDDSAAVDCPIEEGSCDADQRCIADCIVAASCGAIAGEDPAGAEALSRCKASCTTQRDGSVEPKPDTASGDSNGDPDPTDGPVDCPTPLLRCEAECVDPRTSHQHCGDCGQRCGASEACVAGQCKTTTSDCTVEGCPPGYFCDLTDGGCRAGCANDADCAGNACFVAQHACCEAGETACPTGCADLDGDPDNCGNCGKQCPPPPPGGQRQCTQGKCSIACEAGKTECFGECVDLSTNDDHCGKCGWYCPSAADCEDKVCVDKKSCAEVLLCATLCSNPQCTKDCVAAGSSTAKSLYPAAWQCLETTIPSACASACADPNSSACQQCTMQACDGAVGDCFSDS